MYETIKLKFKDEWYIVHANNHELYNLLYDLKNGTLDINDQDTIREKYDSEIIILSNIRAEIL